MSEPTKTTQPPTNPRRGTLEEDIAARILAAIASLRYGSVEVVVHDGRVVQIDRRERTRVDRAES